MSVDPQQVFSAAKAQTYDEQAEALAPLKDVIHLFMRVVFLDLPEDAHILCVGAGTGAEVVYLAETFPRFRFTAVDPAKAMLAQLRQKAESLGIADRCTLHEGYLNTLPQQEPFDAATSILVSHFILDTTDRTTFFKEIASRLRPGGRLLNSDLASGLKGHAYEQLMEIWGSVMSTGGKPFKREGFEKMVSLLPPAEVAELMVRAGFGAPLKLCQTAFMHSWVAERAGAS